MEKVISTKVIIPRIVGGEAVGLGLQVTRDPAGPFKAKETIDIDLEMETVVVCAVESTHVGLLLLAEDDAGKLHKSKPLNFQAVDRVPPEFEAEMFITKTAAEEVPVFGEGICGVIVDGDEGTAEATETTTGDEAADTETEGKPEDGTADAETAETATGDDG